MNRNLIKIPIVHSTGTLFLLSYFLTFLPSYLLTFLLFGNLAWVHGKEEDGWIMAAATRRQQMAGRDIDAWHGNEWPPISPNISQIPEAKKEIHS